MRCSAVFSSMTEKPYRWRAIAIFAAAIACWYVVAYIRTQGYGTQWSDLLSFSLVFFCLFAFPAKREIGIFFPNL